MKHPVYTTFALAVLVLYAATEWSGWTPSRVTEVKDVNPRTVRDNPGSYRPHYIYTGSGRYMRGK